MCITYFSVMQLFGDIIHVASLSKFSFVQKFGKKK